MLSKIDQRFDRPSGPSRGSTEIGVPPHTAASPHHHLKPHHPRFSAMSFQQPTPFTINVSDSLLKQTQEKLREARFPDQLQNVTWEGPSTTPQISKDTADAR